jgi:enoyl-CoA hydratase/carnithine racemase
MSGDPVKLEFGDGGVAVITLDRGDRLNIFGVEMRDAFIEAITAVRDFPGARSLLLRAEGRHFSAGADLSEFGQLRPVEARRVRWDRDPWGPLWDLPQPSVVALHGYAVGAGLEMALLCDIRLASADTVVGLPETKLGMLPAAGGTQSLTRIIGPHAALPTVLMGGTLTAQQARSARIVHDVVDDVESAALDLAQRMAGLDPALASAARRLLHAAGDLPLDSGLALERTLARHGASS